MASKDKGVTLRATMIKLQGQDKKYQHEHDGCALGAKQAEI
jgi:hypothetical protein